MLFECPTCGRSVSGNAGTCPKCGEPNVGEKAKRHYHSVTLPLEEKLAEQYRVEQARRREEAAEEEYEEEPVVIVPPARPALVARAAEAPKVRRPRRKVDAHEELPPGYE